MAGLRIDIDTASAERASKALAQSMGTLGHSAVSTEKDFKKLEDRMIKGMAADKATKNLKELQKSLKMTTMESAKLQASLGDFGGAFKTLNDGFGLSAKAAGAMNTAFIGIGVSAAAATAVIAKSLQTFGQIEKGLIGVRKTTDMTDKQFAGLTTTLEKMALKIPVAATDLLGIAEAAGQLGVKGAANIAKFTETMGKLQLSSDVVGDDGAKSIARLLTVTDTAIGTVDKFGSVLVRLGNSAAASESEILSMALEVGQATSEFAVSASRAAALGAAMKSLGISSELGGSVVGRSMNMIAESIAMGGEKLELVAKTAGMTSEALKDAFGKDSAAVFQKWIAGIGGMSSETKTVAMLLKAFGIEGQEAIKVLGPMAGKADLVAENLATMNDELANSTALNKEAAAAAAGFDSQMILTANALDQIKVIVGGAFAPDVLKIAEGFRDWTSANKELIQTNVAEYVGRLSTALHEHSGELIAAGKGWMTLAEGAAKFALVSAEAIGNEMTQVSDISAILGLWTSGAISFGEALGISRGEARALVKSFEDDFDLEFMKRKLESAYADMESVKKPILGITDDAGIARVQADIDQITGQIEQISDAAASEKFLAAWDKQRAATGVWSESASRDIDDVSGSIKILGETIETAGSAAPPDVAPTIHKMTDAVSRITKVLEEEQWAIGKTDEAILAHKLLQAGATPEEIKAAVAIQKTVDAHKKAAKASIDAEKKKTEADKKALADRKAISAAYIKTYKDEEKAAQDRWHSEIEAMNAAIAEEKRIYDESLAFTMGPEYKESKTAGIDKLYGKRISAGVDEATALAMRAKEIKDLYKEVEDHARNASIEMAKSLDEPGGFFDAFTVGMQTMQDETKTWGEMGLETAEEFSTGSKDLIKAGLFGAIQNDMDGFSDAWDGMWKGMLGTLIDFLSDAAFNDLAGLFGGSGSGSGMGLGGIVSGIGGLFGGGGESYPGGIADSGGGLLSGIGGVISSGWDWLTGRDGFWDILDDGTGHGSDGIPFRVGHPNEMLVPADQAGMVRGILESRGINSFKMLSGAPPAAEKSPALPGYYRDGAWDFSGGQARSIAAGIAPPAPAINSPEMIAYAEQNGISDIGAMGDMMSGYGSSAGFNSGFSSGFMGSISNFGGFRGVASGFGGVASGDFGASSAFGAAKSTMGAAGIAGRFASGGVSGLVGNVGAALQSAGYAGITSGLMGAMGLTSKQAGFGSKLGQAIGSALGGPALGAIGGFAGGFTADAFGDMTDSRSNEVARDIAEEALGPFAGRAAYSALAAEISMPTGIFAGMTAMPTGISASLMAKRAAEINAARASRGALGIDTGTLSASEQTRLAFKQRTAGYQFGWESFEDDVAKSISEQSRAKRAEAEQEKARGGRGSGAEGSGAGSEGVGGERGSGEEGSSSPGGRGGYANGGWTDVPESGGYVLAHGRELILNEDQVSDVQAAFKESSTSGTTTIVIEAPWMADLKATSEAMVTAENERLYESGQQFDPSRFESRYGVDPETGDLMQETVDNFNTISEIDLATWAENAGVSVEELAADMYRLQGALDISAEAAEGRIEVEKRLSERYGRDLSTTEAQQAAVDQYTSADSAEIEAYAESIGVSVAAITSDMALLEASLAEGSTVDLGSGIDQVNAMMEGVDAYYEGIAKNSHIEQLKSLVSGHEDLTKALDDSLSTAEEKAKLQTSQMNELGEALTGLGQQSVADALWSSITSGASSSDFLNSIEDSIRENAARALSDAVSESISSAFISPINDSVGVMVQQIIAGGFTTGAAIEAGVAVLVEQMTAVAELINSAEFKAGMDELYSALGLGVGQIADIDRVAYWDRYRDTLQASEDQLLGFMAGINDQIEEMGLNDIQLQWKNLTDEMNKNLTAAIDLGASEEQLATVRSLSHLKMADLQESIIAQIQDAQASISGEDAPSKLKIQRASDLFGADFSIAENMQGAIDWFRNTGAVEIAEAAVNIGVDLSDIIGYVQFFDDQLNGAADGVVSGIIKIEEAQAKLKGPAFLESLMLDRLNAKYEAFGYDLTSEGGRESVIDLFKTTAPDQLEAYAESIGVSVDELITDIFYLDSSLSDATESIAKTLSDAIDFALDTQAVMLGANQAQVALARGYGISVDDLMAMAPGAINELIGASGEDIRQRATDMGYEGEEAAEYIRQAAKDISQLFKIINDNVTSTRAVLKSAYQAEIDNLQKELDDLTAALDTARDDYLYYLGEEISAQQAISDAAKDASEELKGLSESMGDYLKSLGTEAATLSPAERYEAAGREWQEVVMATKSTDIEVSREAMGRLTDVSSNWLDASQEANALSSEYNADLAAVRAVLTTTQDVANLQAKKQDDIADAAEDQIDELEEIAEEIKGTTRAVDNLTMAADAYYAADIALSGSRNAELIAEYQSEISALNNLTSAIVPLNEALALYTAALNIQRQIDIPTVPTVPDYVAPTGPKIPRPTPVVVNQPIKDLGDRPSPTASLSNALAANDASAADFAQWALSNQNDAQYVSDAIKALGNFSAEDIARVLTTGLGYTIPTSQVKEMIPGFASGGWANGPADGYTATLHGPELVLNPPQVADVQRAIKGSSNKEAKEILAELREIKLLLKGDPSSTTRRKLNRFIDGIEGGELVIKVAS